MAGNIYGIRGILTLTSPAQQSDPEKNGNHTKLLGQTVQTEMGRVFVPTISANSVRGVDRREAATFIEDSLKKRGLTLPRDTYMSIVRGAMSRTGMKTGSATLAATVAARRNAFVGLFGGGAYMFPAKFRMRNSLIPMVSETKFMFPSAYQAHCQGSAANEGIVTQLLLTGRDDMMAGKGDGVIANHAEAFVEYASRANEAGAAKKAQKESARASAQAGERAAIEPAAKGESLATFATLDAIIAGTRLYFDAAIDNPTEAQVGLALLSLLGWANANALGGGTVRGRGSFIPSLSLMRNGQTLVESIFIGDAPGLSLAKHPIIEAATAAAMAELDALTPEELQLVYPSSTEPDKPAKKSKGKAAETEPV